MKAIATLFLATLALTCHAQNAFFYTASYYCDDVILDIEVNGFPVCHLPESGNMGSTANGIGQYLRKRMNEVRIKATPMPKEAADEDKGHLWSFDFYSGPSLDAQKETPDIRAQWLADLAVEEPNGKLELAIAGESFAQLRHAGSNDGGTTRFNTTTNELAYTPATGHTATFLVTLDLPNTPLNSLPWLTPQVALQPSDEAAIKQLVASFQSVIASKDWEAMRTLVSVKLDRIAQATGATADELLDDSVDMFTTIITSDGFALAALDTNQLQIEPVGSLNLVRVTRANKAPIHGQGTEYVLDVPVFISRVGDAWKIVD